MCRNCPVFTDTHDSVLLSGFSLAHIEFFSYAHQHHHHRAHSFLLIDNCKYAVIVVCALYFFLFYLLAVNFIHSRRNKTTAHIVEQSKLNWIDLTWLDWASCEIHLFVFGSILNERNFASSKLWVHSKKRKLGTFHSNCRCLLCLLWSFRMFQYFPVNFGTLFYVFKFVLVVVLVLVLVIIHVCVFP